MKRKHNNEELIEEVVEHWCIDCVHADMKRHKCLKNDIILNKKSHYGCSSYEAKHVGKDSI